MNLWRYSYVGLRVESELEIPEWTEFERADSSDRSDVRIRLAGGQQVQDGPLPDAPIISPDEVCFGITDVASYRVRDGCEIEVGPAPGASWQEIRLFLLGSAWGALCYQRGLLVVHASAVYVSNGAVAFCASRGHGKSTLAAWLTTKGHDLVSDDLTRIELPAEGSALIYPSTRTMKLRPDALEALGWSGPEPERSRHHNGKSHLPSGGDGAGHPVSLRAIYMLDWGELDLRRLTGHAALRRVVSATAYRGTFLESMDRLGLYWRQCLDLVCRVPVWEVRRPHDFSAMEQTLQRLQAHWASGEQEDPWSSRG